MTEQTLIMFCINHLLILLLLGRTQRMFLLKEQKEQVILQKIVSLYRDAITLLNSHIVGKLMGYFKTMSDCFQTYVHSY